MQVGVGAPKTALPPGARYGRAATAHWSLDNMSFATSPMVIKSLNTLADFYGGFFVTYLFYNDNHFRHEKDHKLNSKLIAAKIISISFNCFITGYGIIGLHYTTLPWLVSLLSSSPVSK
jgi:hypothetical protein